jgi:hypothetical protein
LYNILIEFGVPTKLVRLIKMCLNETYSKVRIGKHFSDSFPIQNGLKQRRCSIYMGVQLVGRRLRLLWNELLRRICEVAGSWKMRIFTNGTHSRV